LGFFFFYYFFKPAFWKAQSAVIGLPLGAVNRHCKNYWNYTMTSVLLYQFKPASDNDSHEEQSDRPEPQLQA